MSVLLLNHAEGCAPLQPCISCKAARFLERKLSPEDLGALIDILTNAVGKPPYSSENPAPDVLLLETLAFTVRTKNCIAAENIKTVGELCAKTNIELLRLPNFTSKGTKEIQRVLEGIGRSLRTTSVP